MSSLALRRLQIRLRFALAAIFALLGLLPGCFGTRVWVERERPWTSSTLAEAKEVRVESADGSHLTLEHPRIVHEGHGDFLTGRAPSLGEKETRIDLATVRSLEVREVDAAATTETVAFGVVIVAAGVLFLLFG